MSITTKGYIGGVLVAVGAVLFWVLVLPTYNQISQIRTTVNDRTAQLKDRTSIIATINSLNTQYSQNSAAIMRFGYVVPQDKDPADIITMLSAMADQNGVQLNTATLGDVPSEDPNPPYLEESVDMTVIGDYPQFRSFLDALEQNIRLIDVDSINGNPIGTSVTNISFQIKANTYYLPQP